MKRFLKRAFIGFVPAALTAVVFGASTASSELGLQNVNLSCNDGTNLDLALDASAVTQLTNAVSAINLFPAGDPALACSLRQTTAASSSSSSTNGNAPQDFVVGGGQYLTTCGIANFAISAHAPAGVTAPGTAKGTWNFSLPASSACGKSSINSQVDCLAVAGNTADTTEHVTKASGTTLATLQGQELSVEAVDGAPDALSPDGGFLTTAPCNFDSESVTPILHGNIDVHDN